MHTSVAMRFVFLFLLSLTSVSHADLRILVLDVGQGDSTIIVSPTGESLLIDSGGQGDGAEIRTAMNTLGITQLNHAVITHYHC